MKTSILRKLLNKPQLKLKLQLKQLLRNHQNLKSLKNLPLKNITRARVLSSTTMLTERHQWRELRSMLSGLKKKSLPFWRPNKRRKSTRETDKEQSNFLTAEVDLMKILKPSDSAKELLKKLNKGENLDNKTIVEEKAKRKEPSLRSKISLLSDPHPWITNKLLLYKSLIHHFSYSLQAVNVYIV